MLFKVIVTVVLPLSIWLAVFSIGAKASFSDLVFLFRQPHRLMRAMAAIFVVVPAFAIAISLIFTLEPEIKFALVALSVSPVPPALVLKQQKAGAQESYVIGLLVAVSLVSLVATPLLLGFAAKILGADVTTAPGEVARVVAMSIGLPLAVGIGLQRMAPHTGEILSRYANVIGSVLLKAGAVVLLVAAWPNIMAQTGNGAIIAIAATVIVALVAGQLLGSKHGNADAALGLAAASRHPGVAMAIGAANFPEHQKTIAAAVLLYLVVSGVATTVYTHWMKRQRNLPAFDVGHSARPQK